MLGTFAGSIEEPFGGISDVGDDVVEPPGWEDVGFDVKGLEIKPGVGLAAGPPGTFTELPADGDPLVGETAEPSEGCCPAAAGCCPGCLPVALL